VLKLGIEPRYCGVALSKARLVLVVEDDILSMRLMADLLLAFGFDVVEATSGEQALVLVESCQPDIVLMDIRLPGMTGFQALRAMRSKASTRDVPVIAVTASVMLGEREKIMQAGFTGYHPKPVQIPQLLKEIEQTLAVAPKHAPKSDA
jgi:two-component system, cell cycle response regulator DivK